VSTHGLALGLIICIHILIAYDRPSARTRGGGEDITADAVLLTVPLGEFDNDMLTPTGYPPPSPTQRPIWPTAHIAHSQHMGCICLIIMIQILNNNSTGEGITADAVILTVPLGELYRANNNDTDTK